MKGLVKNASQAIKFKKTYLKIVRGFFLFFTLRSFGKKDYKSPLDVPNNQWKYIVNEKFKATESDDINVKCVDVRGKCLNPNHYLYFHVCNRVGISQLLVTMKVQ